MTTPIHAFVVTVSDACASGDREDASGAALIELLQSIGAKIVGKTILSDDLAPLTNLIKQAADRADVNLLITTGGTGNCGSDAHADA